MTPPRRGPRTGTTATSAKTCGGGERERPHHRQQQRTRIPSPASALAEGRSFAALDEARKQEGGTYAGTARTPIYDALTAERATTAEEGAR